MSTSDVRVGILAGSGSDGAVVSAAADRLQFLRIGHEVTVRSAQRSPQRTAEYAIGAGAGGLPVISAGAGMAAYLAGVVAAHTTLPVIGEPLDASSLSGLDALVATIQMPPGLAVATVEIGKPGADDAANVAAHMLAVVDPDLAARLDTLEQALAREGENENACLQRKRHRR